MDGDHESLIDGPGYVVLRCKHCQHDIARAAYSPFNWTHLEDETLIQSQEYSEGAFGWKVTKSWDHEAEPDVIDVGAPQQTASMPPPPPKKWRSNPFY